MQKVGFVMKCAIFDSNIVRAITVIIREIQGLANGIANSMEIQLEKPSLLILFPKCQENLIIHSRVDSTGSVIALHLTELC